MRAMKNPAATYEGKPLPLGTRVRCFSPRREKLIGDGRLIPPTMFLPGHGPIPRIRLDNGRILQGLDCWWIPLRVARAVERRKRDA